VFPAYPTDLCRRLVDSSSAIPPPEASLISRALKEALGYCHAMRVVHADVKCENILLTPWGHTTPAPVLCDFSRAFSFPEDSPLHSLVPHTFAGTYAYASPESLLHFCGPPSDAWGLGVVLFCVVEREIPFDPVPFAGAHRPVCVPDETQEFVYDETAWSSHAPFLAEWTRRTLRRRWDERALPLQLDLLTREEEEAHPQTRLVTTGSPPSLPPA
jgi:serine/threonine protein kinase